MRKNVENYVEKCEKYGTEIAAHELAIDQINQQINKLNKKMDRLKELREKKGRQNLRFLIGLTYCWRR